MSDCPAARPLFSDNKVYFTVDSTEDCKFKYRGKEYNLEVPEEVNKGDQVVATIDMATNRATYVRNIRKTGMLKRTSKRGRSKLGKSKRGKSKGTRRR